MKSRILESQGTFRPMMRLALPVLVEYLLHVLVNYVDLWLAGNYLTDPSGQEAYVAAITQVGYVMWFTFNLFAVVAIGATALVARFVGANEWEQARRCAGQALLLGVALAVLVVCAGATGIDALVRQLQLHGGAAEFASEYLWIILYVIPAIMLNEVAIAALRGAGDMVSGLIVMSIVNGVNLLISASLLLGLGPFPELGWRGLAIGSAIGHAVGAAILLVMLLRGRAGIKLSLSRLTPDMQLMRRLLRVGIPGGADALAVVLCHFWYVSIINQLGTLQTAAHGIGVRVEALAYMPATAFQAAAATLCGQFLGAGDIARARRSALVAVLAAEVLLSAVGAVFFFGSRPLTTFFLGGGDSAVVPITTYLLQIVALTMPPFALTAVLSGALRGAGDTRWPLAITLVGFLVVRIPLAYLFAREGTWHATETIVIQGFGWGVAGAWYAMVADVVVRAALISWRFMHGGWSRVVV
ncbi:MAG: MATE family efflux transporter [Planctomycetales bacterium]|nr:MATE family efflux transporter [Planctomycetales bacterium]